LLEDLEPEEVEFGLGGEFLLKLKKKFGRGDKESVKVAELRRIEQGGKTVEEFVQRFQRAARSSKYERRALVEKFKREMNGVIKRKLIKTERPPNSIEQWYKCAINLDRHWRESKREEERLRGGRKNGNQRQR